MIQLDSTGVDKQIKKKSLNRMGRDGNMRRVVIGGVGGGQEQMDIFKIHCMQFPKN